MGFYFEEFKKLEAEENKSTSRVVDDIDGLLGNYLYLYDMDNYNSKDKAIELYIKILRNALRDLRTHLDKNVICVIEDFANGEFIQRIHTFSFKGDFSEIYICLFNYIKNPSHMQVD